MNLDGCVLEGNKRSLYPRDPRTLFRWPLACASGCSGKLPGLPFAALQPSPHQEHTFHPAQAQTEGNGTRRFDEGHRISARVGDPPPLFGSRALWVGALLRDSMSQESNRSASCHFGSHERHARCNAMLTRWFRETGTAWFLHSPTKTDAVLSLTRYHHTFHPPHSLESELLRSSKAGGLGLATPQCTMS